MNDYYFCETFKEISNGSHKFNFFESYLKKKMGVLKLGKKYEKSRHMVQSQSSIMSHVTPVCELIWLRAVDTNEILADGSFLDFLKFKCGLFKNPNKFIYLEDLTFKPIN